MAAGSLTPAPAGLSDADAAAAGVAHRTAIHVLRSTARLAAGEELVVLGAGGGVGLAAVQLGVALGATVTAVASSDDKLAVAAEHGAAHLVRHGEADLRGALREALPDGADVVVDPVGGDLAEPALRSLRYGGRFVSVGYASGDHPPDPAQPRAAEGHRGPRLRVPRLRHPRARGDAAQRGGAPRPARERPRAPAHRRHLPARRRPRPRCGYVADGRAIGKVVIDVAGAAAAHTLGIEPHGLRSAPLFRLRFDMRAPGCTAEETARLYEAALEMSAYADEHGCQGIAISEHHASEDGYLPSPLTMAAAVAAVTSTRRSWWRPPCSRSTTRCGWPRR